MIAPISGCTRKKVGYNRFGGARWEIHGRLPRGSSSAARGEVARGSATGPDRQPKGAITCDPAVGSRLDFYSGFRRPFSL